MAIKAQFKMDSIRQSFANLLKGIELAQIDALERLGEQCVIHARNIQPEYGGFGDVTGALRSSIGYGVYKDGVPVSVWFEQAQGANSDGKPLTGTALGVEKGRELADKVGTQTKGIVLVVVAGMNYATYVEAKGRDVLASAETLAQRELPKVLSEFISDIKKGVRDHLNEIQSK